MPALKTACCSSRAAVSKQGASNRLVVQDEHDAPKTIYRRTNEDTIESIEVHVFTAYIGLVFRCEGVNEKDIVHHMFFLLEMDTICYWPDNDLIIHV